MGKTFSKKHLIYVILFALLAGAIVLLTAWRSGAFYLRETITSPDGTIRAAVYERPYPWSVTHDGPEEDVPSTTVVFNGNLNSGGGSICPNTTYIGAWWSPDSQKFLIKMNPLSDSAIALDLIDFERNASTHLCVTIPVSMEQTGLCGNGFLRDSDGSAIVDLQFVEWSETSDAIRFRYAFTDVESEHFSGTFWYHPGNFFDQIPVGKITDIVPD